jgi:hypothetical protein
MASHANGTPTTVEIRLALAMPANAFLYESGNQRRTNSASMAITGTNAHSISGH